MGTTTVANSGCVSITSVTGTFSASDNPSGTQTTNNVGGTCCACCLQCGDCWFNQCSTATITWSYTWGTDISPTEPTSFTGIKSGSVSAAIFQSNDYPGDIHWYGTFVDGNGNNCNVFAVYDCEANLWEFSANGDGSILQEIGMPCTTGGSCDGSFTLPCNGGSYTNSGNAVYFIGDSTLSNTCSGTITITINNNTCAPGDPDSADVRTLSQMGTDTLSAGSITVLGSGESGDGMRGLFRQAQEKVKRQKPAPKPAKVQRSCGSCSRRRGK